MIKIIEWLKKEKVLIEIQTNSFEFRGATPQWSLVLLLAFVLYMVVCK